MVAVTSQFPRARTCQRALAPSRCSAAWSLWWPRLLLLALWSAEPSAALHPCDTEAGSACPETPGAELAACLKDQSQHERPTTISSDCTDFIALNVACAADITQFCDDAFFSDDTMLCLTQWTDQRSLSQKCSSVLKWAVPRTDDEATDELGMSEKDYDEKKEWQAKRRAERGAAIEKLKSHKAEMQEDAELEALKKENIEEYKQRKKEREEARRSFEEAKRRKRLIEAAKERKRREEMGLPPVDDEAEAEAKKKRARAKPTKQQTDWLPYAFGGLFLLVFGSAALQRVFGEKNDKAK